ncbi:MAG: TIGR03032 family protein, partial [Lacipirellulaceae bacterium]
MASPKKPAPIEVVAHGEFLEWLESTGGTLLVTTYNSGKLASFSVGKGGLHVKVWKFPRPMGMAIRGNKIALAAREYLRVFSKAESNLFTLETKYATGRLDMHDVAFGRRGIYFMNTKFNCLARPSSRVNFLRSWQPSFIEEMRPKDCCHLNGLGMCEGRPTMVTAFGETSEPKGWRSLDRLTSGVVIDVAKNETVVSGLCMPHSPRWHDSQWWLCNSGIGGLEKFDPLTGTRTTVSELPGFTRGLSFVGKVALVGLSKILEKHILDTPLLRKAESTVQAGVAAVEADTGRLIGRLEFTKGGSEVYEVTFVPGVKRVE